jgi:hypothetical protein
MIGLIIGTLKGERKIQKAFYNYYVDNSDLKENEIRSLITTVISYF